MVISIGTFATRPPSVMRHANAIHSCLDMCSNPQLWGYAGDMSVSILTTHMSRSVSSTSVKMNMSFQLELTHGVGFQPLR